MECKSNHKPIIALSVPKVESPGSYGSNTSLSISGFRGVNTILEASSGNSLAVSTAPIVGFWRKLINSKAHKEVGHTKHSSG